MTKRYLGPVLLALLVAGCESSLVTDPTASIDAGTALDTERGIELAVNGAYRSLMAGGLWGRTMQAFPDLYADNLEFTGTYTTDREFALRSVSASNGAVTDTWTAAYGGINRANAILAAIPEVEMDAGVAAQYTAEARFIRALLYTNLVMWFGGVPIVTEPAVGVGEQSLVPRATAAEVWSQIEADLNAASAGLPAAGSERASQAAVDALLARVYLEQDKYTQARDAAAAVINLQVAGEPGYELVPFADVFGKKHSAESIFELTYTVNSQNALAFWFFPQALGGRWGFAPTDELFAAYEPGDVRRDVTIGNSDGDLYGQKYTRISNGDDNVLVLRLAEMYLIRAEANARLGAAADVVRADINIVRQRANATPVPATVTSQADLLQAILDERRLEFAMEGHRFFDLRRHGQAEAVLTIGTDKLILPIPQAERDVNPNLTQNPGY